MDKRAQLLQLAKKRQNYYWPEYKHIGDYHNGIYECNDYVSPYSKSAHNVDAKVMIMLQDWCSDKFLSNGINEDADELGYDPTLPTNKNLKQLLDNHFRLTLADTYATNLFPFIKRGGMSTKIPMSDMIKAAKEFALPQIKIISPELVICLGLATFNALRRALGFKSAKNLNEGIALPFRYKGSVIYCQAHTGQLGKNNRNRGGVDRVNKDWELMSKIYQDVS